jgi:hypothetical protein
MRSNDKSQHAHLQASSPKQPQCIHELMLIWLNYPAMAWRSLPRAK